MEDLIPEHRRFKARRPPRFELIAGAVCLDFINTLDDRFSDHPKELLGSYLDLVRFGEDAGIISDLQMDSLAARSLQVPGEAQHTLTHAIRMREAMHEIFWAVVQSKPAPRAALLVLNGYVQGASLHASLVPGPAHFEWKFEETTTDFDAPLWEIARSAADLLASDQLQRVRACASKTCEWLFLDESKNHRRRWCDMTKCGNRAKVRNFYSRQKKASSRE